MQETGAKVVLKGQVDPSFRSLDHRMSGVLGSLRTQLAGLTGAFGFGMLIRQGVQFNVQLERARSTLAVIFRQNDPGLRTFDAALSRGGKAVDLLKEKALKSSADFSDLMTAYSTNAGMMFAAGVRDLEKQIELVTLLGDAVRSMGLSGPQFIQEIRAIFTGQLQGAQVARTLFASPELLARYRAALKGQGEDLGDLLLEVLGPYKEAAERAGDRFDVVVSNFGEAVTSLSSEFLQGPLKDFTVALKEFTGFIKSEGFKQGLGIGIRGGSDLLALLAGGYLFGKGKGLARKLVAPGGAASLLRSGGKGLLALLGIEMGRNAYETWRAGAQGMQARRDYMENLDNLREALHADIASKVKQGLLPPDVAADIGRNLETGMLHHGMAAFKEIAAEVRRLAGPAPGQPSLAAEALAQWQGELPWTVAGGRGRHGRVNQGWLTRGAVRLWQAQINYAKSMARDLGLIADAVRKYLPKLQEEI